MSAPNKEYLIAKATLCRDLAVKQIVAGEGEQAAKNLMRMVKALGEVGVINEREDKAMNKWSVWVGGGEINDYHLTTLAEAEELAQIWKDKGYDEVAIEEIK
jgi:hypothetical protein